LSSVISIVAVAPAGITAPFEPVTLLETVALNLCPTRFVFVQMREFDVRLISEPAGMEPSPRSEPRVPGVTVLPLGVRVGDVGAAGGRGVVRAGVRLVVVRLGVERAGAGAAATVVGESVAGMS
jgi:hypothetical protein